MVDPDVPFETIGTKDQPLIHWLVINAPSGRISQGTTLHSYKGPRPPDSAAHTYYFLLYRHLRATPLNLDSTSDYTTGCDRLDNQILSLQCFSSLKHRPRVLEFC